VFKPTELSFFSWFSTLFLPRICYLVCRVVSWVSASSIFPLGSPPLWFFKNFAQWLLFFFSLYRGCSPTANHPARLAYAFVKYKFRAPHPLGTFRPHCVRLGLLLKDHLKLGLLLSPQSGAATRSSNFGSKEVRFLFFARHRPNVPPPLPRVFPGFFFSRLTRLPSLIAGR